MRSSRNRKRSSSKFSESSARPVMMALEQRLFMSGSPLSSIPALSSRPGATAKIYLDFDGDYTANWGSYKPGSTPAYDTDGDPSSFSGTELNNIRDIWARVAEKYSPFNIDVTTVNPGNLTDRVTARAVIGGSGSWAGGGGISYIGGFYNSTSNSAYIFSSNLGGGQPNYVAESVSHETGHLFGLYHQAAFSGNSLAAEYNPGNGATAPIMGNSYTATRGMWYYGKTPSGSYQDDLSILSSATNGFGYRADDVGDWITAASGLNASGNSRSASGVITNTSDWDYFSFYTGSGNVSFNVTTPPSGMLDPNIRIVNSSGQTVASSDSGLNESINTWLSAGTYYLAVGSHGNYGDIGGYNISGTVGSGSAPVAATPAAPAAPSNLSASSSSTSQVNLSWADNSNNETGFKIDRSVNGGAWSEIAVVSANQSWYTDSGLSAGTAYAYRVHSTNSAGDSGYSNSASATTNSPTVSANGTKVTGTVIGTAGSWNNNASVNMYAAVDGSTSTYFDAPANQGWVGYDLGSAKLISGVRYFPRAGQASRMIGGAIQGSNDGSNWSTVGSISQAAEGQWNTLNFSSPAGYRYVRYLSPQGGYGNVAEIEFYSTGNAAIVTPPVTNNNANGSKVTGTVIGTAGSWNNSGADIWSALDGNLRSFFDAPTQQGWVGYDLGSAKTITAVRYAPRSGQAARMVGGAFQGSNDGANWNTLGTINSTPADGTYTTLNLAKSGSYRYVRYLSPNGGYGNAAEIEFYANGTTAPATSSPKLTGTAFGTAGSWNNSGMDYLCAIDGNASSYFDAPTSQAYVGLDLGSAKYVNSVRYMPRTGQPGRMVGGMIQGSNDGSNWNTLLTINSTPAEGAYTSANLTSPGTYRYVRYLSPQGGYGNIADIEFYSTAASSQPAFSQTPLVSADAHHDDDGEAHPTPVFSTTPITSDLLIGTPSLG